MTFAAGPITVACCLFLAQTLIKLPVYLANAAVGAATFLVYAVLLEVAWELCERSFKTNNHLLLLGQLLTLIVLLFICWLVYRPVPTLPQDGENQAGTHSMIGNCDDEGSVVSDSGTTTYSLPSSSESVV